MHGDRWRDRAEQAPCASAGVSPMTCARHMVRPRWLADSMWVSPPSATRRAFDAASRAARSLAKLPTWIVHDTVMRACAAGRTDGAARLAACAVPTRLGSRFATAVRRSGGTSNCEALIQQRCHVRVALRVGAGAQHDPDQANAAVNGAGDEIVARRLGIAGLHAVRPRIGLQHPVMVEDDAVPEGEAMRAEIGIESREVRQQVSREDREVAGRAPLIRIGQARRIGKGCATHAQRAGAQCHHLGEPVLGTAQQFAERRRGVIGGLGDQAEDRLLHGKPRAGREP